MRKESEEKKRFSRGLFLREFFCPPTKITAIPGIKEKEVGTSNCQNLFIKLLNMTELLRFISFSSATQVPLFYTQVLTMVWFL